MSLNTTLVDPNSGHPSQILTKDGYQGLHVITSPMKEYKNKSQFFSNPLYGVNMNQDFSTVDATENVHNGEDNTYWTATVTVGVVSDFDFSSDTYAHTGTQSIDCTPAENGDQFQLANDTLISSGTYDQLVGWIYITGNFSSLDDGARITLFNTNTGIEVSLYTVILRDYITEGDTDIWQRFAIPLSDFGTLSDDYDAIRWTVYGQSTPPDYYLDDIQLLDLGGSDLGRFEIAPPKGVWWHIQGFGIAMAAAYSPVLTDSTMPKIPYSGFLGVPMTNGTTYQRTESGEVQFAFVINSLIDILNQYDTSITSYGSDGTNTFLKIDVSFRSPFLLKSEYEDFISFQFVDDMSAMKYLRIVADVKEEHRTRAGQFYDFENNDSL